MRRLTGIEKKFGIIKSLKLLETILETSPNTYKGIIARNTREAKLLCGLFHGLNCKYKDGAEYVYIHNKSYRKKINTRTYSGFPSTGHSGHYVLYDPLEGTSNVGFGEVNGLHAFSYKDFLLEIIKYLNN